MTVSGYPQMTFYMTVPVRAALDALMARNPELSKTKVVQHALLVAAASETPCPLCVHPESNG
jgi:hypothetical protein